MSFISCFTLSAFGIKVFLSLCLIDSDAHPSGYYLASLLSPDISLECPTAASRGPQGKINACSFVCYLFTSFVLWTYFRFSVWQMVRSDSRFSESCKLGQLLLRLLNAYYFLEWLRFDYSGLFI